MYALAYPQGIPTNNPIFKFYAIFILLGGVVALFLSNYRAYKDGKDFNYFYTIFAIAFPSGIIGARIWYVIASWSEFASREWYKVFYFWEGGLAIQGGAIGGVLIGILVALKLKKDNPILRITDYCVPTILIAQAIGRWGNFYNQEVFGHAVSPTAWNFLPGFITSNMQNGNNYMLSSVKLPADSIAVPLFLVEGIINIMFYFLITYGYQAVVKKKYLDGDQTILYFIAYGIVRLVLEPLRNTAFIMGSTGGDLSRSHYKSLLMAIAFILVGVILLIANHLTVYLLNKKNIKSPLHSYHLASEYLDTKVNKTISQLKEEKIESKNESVKNEIKTDDSFLKKLKDKENKDE